MCVGRYAAATERSGVAAKCLLLGNSTQGFLEECDNGRSFSFFGKIISSMLIGSLFPADAACRVPTAFNWLYGFLSGIKHMLGMRICGNLWESVGDE